MKVEGESALYEKKAATIACNCLIFRESGKRGSNS